MEAWTQPAAVEGFESSDVEGHIHFRFKTFLDGKGIGKALPASLGWL